MLLAEIDFVDVLWSMVFFFFFVIFLWMIFGIVTDIFRSHDLSGWAKALWCIFLVFFPWLMIFVYLIVRGRGMARRSAQAGAEAQAQFDDYVRQTASTATTPADQIRSAKELLDNGTITPAEFEHLKAHALGAT